MVTLGDVGRSACEMHGVGAMTMGIGGDGRAGTAPSGAAEHQHERSQSDRIPEECHCSCIGACTATAPLASLVAAPTLRVDIADAEPRRLFDAPSGGTEPAETDRLLPFANGPPAALTL